MNKRKLDMFNHTNFTKNVIMYTSQFYFVCIDSAKGLCMQW